MDIIGWLQTNWTAIAIPAAVFGFALISTFYIRKVTFRVLERWLKKLRPEVSEMIARVVWGPSAIWALIVSVYLGLAVSMAPAGWKGFFGKVLWTLFLISLTVSAIAILANLVSYYGRSLRLPERAIAVSLRVSRLLIIIIALLIALDIWNVPTTPLFLFIFAILLAAALVFRDAVPNFFAGMQLGASQQIKVGDYIKLETGEEGYVMRIDWNSTQLHTPDDRTLIIPNSRLLQKSVINYGRPLNKAKEPFRFNSRTYIRELTGLKAKNLQELADVLKKAPDSVFDYHTHRFLEEHQYLSPEPSSDFAVWVDDAIGDEVLAERLASVDTYSFPNLGALRGRLVDIIEEHLASKPTYREAMEGREFFFVKSVSVVMPSPYVAHDLREFVEALRRISPGSLYFHVFESRLRLGRGMNDFSIWFKDSLGETDLAEEIARVDPYTLTLEALRSLLIQRIEKRIK